MFCCCRSTANSRLLSDCCDEDWTKVAAWARIVTRCASRDKASCTGCLLLDGWMMMRQSAVMTDERSIGVHFEAGMSQQSESVQNGALGEEFQSERQAL